MPFEQLSLNQATTETTPTVRTLAACASAGVGAVSLWRHKYIEGDASVTARAVRDAGLEVSSLCRGGFFTGTRSEAAAGADNLRAIEEAVQLAAPVLVLVCGPALNGDIAAAEATIRTGIEGMLVEAAAAGVTLAIEPFHPMFLAERSAIVTLAQANRLLEEIAHPSLRIAVDTYHVWWDPDLMTELDRAAGRVAAVHVGDWLVPTPELLAGRGLPGDGVIPLGSLVAEIHTRTGFDGPLEVEVLNRDVWARPAEELVIDVKERMTEILRIGTPSGDSAVGLQTSP